MSSVTNVVDRGEKCKLTFLRKRPKIIILLLIKFMLSSYVACFLGFSLFEEVGSFHKERNFNLLLY